MQNTRVQVYAEVWWKYLFTVKQYVQKNKDISEKTNRNKDIQASKKINWNINLHETLGVKQEQNIHASLVHTAPES